jgi:hypothetical protein
VKTVDHRTGGQRELYPDFLARFANRHKDDAVVLDIKWSIPRNRSSLIQTLTEVTKYGGPLTGWPNPDSSITPTDLVLLCHGDDADRVRVALESLVADDAKAYGYLARPGYSVWAWGEVRTKDGREVVRISKVWGTVSEPRMRAALADHVDFLKAEYLVEQGIIGFVGDEPPIAYVILYIIRVIQRHVFGLKSERSKVISLEELDGVFSHLFPPIGVGTGPQLRQSKLKEAMDILSEIGHSVKRLPEEKVRDLKLDSAKEWYALERRLPEGDLYKWICRQLERIRRKRKKATKAAERKRVLRVSARQKRYKVTRDQRKWF